MAKGAPRQTYQELPVDFTAEALGRLIELMNPYANPTCVQHDEQRMQYLSRESLPTEVPTPPTTRSGRVAQFEVELDNYEADWTIRGQTFRITRALRIPYRYQVRNGRTGETNGVWATEWLFIGYGGGNGS
jgi:hypothetical protein